MFILKGLTATNLWGPEGPTDFLSSNILNTQFLLLLLCNPSKKIRMVIKVVHREFVTSLSLACQSNIFLLKKKNEKGERSWVNYPYCWLSTPAHAFRGVAHTQFGPSLKSCFKIKCCFSRLKFFDHPIWVWAPELYSRWFKLTYKYLKRSKMIWQSPFFCTTMPGKNITVTNLGGFIMGPIFYLGKNYWLEVFQNFKNKLCCIKTLWKFCAKFACWD